MRSVSVAARSEAVGLDRLDAETVGSNPAEGIDICPRLSVLCCPVYLEAGHLCRRVLLSV
jgi:hypothetical protein